MLYRRENIYGDYILSNISFWAGTSSDGINRLAPNFYVKQNGYLFSKYGKIGNWYIGDGGLYQNKMLISTL